MQRWVLLRHVLPDGPAHLDWLLEPPAVLGEAGRAGGAGSEGLMSFRLADGTDPLVASGFVAERIADHRREYLEYEGPVSGGRGEVCRVAEGECSTRLIDGSLWLELAGSDRVLVGTPGGQQKALWRFELAHPA